MTEKTGYIKDLIFLGNIIKSVGIFKRFSALFSRKRK